MIAFNVFRSKPQGVYPPESMLHTPKYDLMMVEHPAGKKNQFTHVNSRSETVIVLKGSGTFTVDGEETVLKRGDVFHIPAHKPHGPFQAGRNGYRALQIEA